jgi:hypothetical protein
MRIARGRRSKRRGPLRTIARRADELGEVLGEEHDLALLAERIEERALLTRSSRKALRKLIARRRRRLRRRALREGERLYARRPKRFVREVRAAYRDSAPQGRPRTRPR